MVDNTLNNDDLEKELKKAWKENKVKRDQCGLLLPTNKDVNLRRTYIGKKRILPRVN